MKTSYHYILFFMFISTINLSRESHWLIEPNDYDELKLKLGSFKQLTFKLTKINDNISYKSTKISLPTHIDNFPIYSIKDSYSVYPLNQTIFSIEIGVKCSYQPSPARTYSFKFTLEDGDNYKSSDIILTFDTNPIHEIEFTIPHFIPIDGFSVISLKSNPHNLDEIRIDIESNDSEIQVAPFTIPIYSGDKYYNSFYTKIYFEGKEEKETAISLSITNNECYTQSINEIKLKTIKDNISNILDSTVTVSNIDESAFEIRLKPVKTPSITYCVIVPENTAFPNNKNIKTPNTNENNSIIRFHRAYYETSSDQSIFSLKALNRLYAYKIKCLYENNINERRYGNKVQSKEVIIKEKIDLSVIDLGNRAICANWRYNTVDLDQKEFEDKLMVYCELKFNSKTKVNRDDDGCLYCNIRDTKDIFKTNDKIKTSSLCLSSSVLCNSRYSNDNIQVFKEDIVSKLLSPEDIKINLNVIIDLIPNEPITYEIEELLYTKPLAISNIILQEKTLSYKVNPNIKVKNKDTLPVIQCSHQINLSSSLIVFSDDFNSVFINGNNKTIQTSLPKESQVNDNNKYTLSFKCNYLPYHNSVILSKSFTIIKFINQRKEECSKETNNYNSYCLRTPKLKLPSFKTSFPSDSIYEKKFEVFNQLSQDDLMIYIENQLEDGISQFNLTGYDYYLKMYFELAIMKLLQCTNTLYSSCHIMKQNIIKKYLKSAKANCNIHALDQSFLIENIDKNVKVLLMGWYSLASSIESFDLEDANDFLKYISAFLSKIEEMILMITNDSTIQNKANVIHDIISLSLSISSQTIQLIKYIEVDKGFNVINDKSKIIKNANLDLFNSGLSSIFKLSLINNVIINQEAFDYDVITITSEENDLKTISFHNNKLTFNLPIANIKQSHSDLYGIVVISYNTFIYHSINATMGYNTNVASIKLYSIEKEIVNPHFSDNIIVNVGYDIKDSSLTSFKYCYSYNGANETGLTVSNVTTFIYNDTYIECRTKSISDIIIGNIYIGGVIEKDESIAWIIILSIVFGLIFLSIVVYFITFIIKGPANDNSGLLSEMKLND